MTLYKPAIRVTSYRCLLGFALLIGKIAWIATRRRQAFAAVISDIDNLVLFVGGASIILIAIGGILSKKHGSC